MELLKMIEAKLPVGEDKQTDIVNLDGVPYGQLSPPFADTIPMDVEFSPFPYINGFVRNILYREVRLTVKAWRDIIDFITKKDFVDLSSRICLQILFLYSKADPVELERVGNTYDTLFEKHVSRFLDCFEAERMHDDEVKNMKERLALPVVRKAITKCLQDTIDKDFDDSKLPTMVESMNFYKGNVDFRLRGVTLCDGIFINRAYICSSSGTKNEADLITISGHEAVHYLARKLSNNYNFSTPKTGRIDGDLRKDPCIPNKNLELGRLFELTVFGVQPDWFSSSPGAAETFLRLVQDNSIGLPLVIGYGLEERPLPSSSFGIDPWIERKWFMC